MSYFELYNGGSCTCHTGHPPCNWCTDTFECESCGERTHIDYQEETEHGYICDECNEVLGQISPLQALGLIGEQMLIIIILGAYAASLHDLTTYLLNTYHVN